MEASSAINTPHVDDPNDEAVFDQGGPEPDPEVPEEAEVSEPSASPRTPKTPEETPETVEVDPDPSTDPPEPSTDPAEPRNTPAVGTVMREYIVFHKVALGVKHLRALIARLERGEIDAINAYFELHRSTERNDRAAITAAYAANHEQLDSKVKLVAVSSRSFKEREVEPEEVPAERKLKIT